IEVESKKFIQVFSSEWHMRCRWIVNARNVGKNVCYEFIEKRFPNIDKNKAKTLGISSKLFGSLISGKTVVSENGKEVTFDMIKGEENELRKLVFIPFCNGLGISDKVY